MSFSSDNILTSRFNKDWATQSPENGNAVEQRSTQNANRSVLLEGTTIRGAFECNGDLKLDGFIEGDVVVHGTITIGESAVVRANVRAKSAIVFGKLVGDLFCSDKIEFHIGAQVRGNLKTRKLLIQDGVVFDGRCEMAPDQTVEEE